MSREAGRARFSHVSIRLAANELQAAAPAASIDHVLQKLLLIDNQIGQDFDALNADLATANAALDASQRALQEEGVKRKRLEELSRKQHMEIERLRKQAALITAGVSGRSGGEKWGGKGESVEVATGGRDRAVLAEMSSENLCDLLAAREEAYRRQQALVRRLKRDNTELKATYDKLWERYQVMYARGQAKTLPTTAKAMASAAVTVVAGGVAEGAGKGVGEVVEVSVDERIEHLSFRVQQAGQAACNVASRVEERLQLTAKDVQTFHSTWKVGEDGEVEVEESLERDGERVRVEEEEELQKENERFKVAGAELIQTLALQQEAHDRLRRTVVELTEELERMRPGKMIEIEKCQAELEETRENLDEANATLGKKAVEIANLQREIKKVTAEYEAVSIAHSYSNAELSKIRATNRARTKLDRQANDRPAHHGKALGVLDGVENLLHHRKNYFR